MALHASVGIHGDNAAVAASADVLVLAVKPQLMAGVARQIAAGPRRAGQLILSVAAGITLASLRGWFGAGRAAGAGHAQPAGHHRRRNFRPGSVRCVGPRERQIAQYIAAATGQAVWLDDEALMDAVTAVSGSGPAYFYLLMEHMERAAVELGLSPELAAALTRETALGAARVVIETKADPAACGLRSPRPAAPRQPRCRSSRPQTSRPSFSRRSLLRGIGRPNSASQAAGEVVPCRMLSLFVLRTLFELYVLTFALRLLLQWAAVDKRNPLVQFILRVTNPLVIPLAAPAAAHRPDRYGHGGRALVGCRWWEPRCWSASVVRGQCRRLADPGAGRAEPREPRPQHLTWAIIIYVS